jgi:hypothetical protein
MKTKLQQKLDKQNAKTEQNELLYAWYERSYKNNICYEMHTGTYQHN